MGEYEITMEIMIMSQTITETERLEVAVTLLSDRQLDEYAEQCKELEQTSTMKLAKFLSQFVEAKMADNCLDSLKTIILAGLDEFVVE